MGTFAKLNITLVAATNSADTDKCIWIWNTKKESIVRKEFEKMSENKSRNTNTHPDKGTKRYAQNEKIINNNSALKKARDISQGIVKKDSAYGDTSAGKGSSVRGNSEQYKSQYANIKWTKPEHKEKPKFKVRINGVLQYADEPEIDPQVLDWDDLSDD